MKTTILTIAIALSTVFGISQSAKAATGSKEEVSTILTDVSKISQVEVHGNVELYLSDGTADQDSDRRARAGAEHPAPHGRAGG